MSVSGPPKLDFRGWMTVLYWPVSRCAKVQRPKNHQVRGEAGMGRGLRNQVEQVAEEGVGPHPNRLVDQGRGRQGCL